MKQKSIPAFCALFFTAALALIDQLLKAWAETALGGGNSIPCIPGVLDFRLIYNDGAAFSLLAGKQGLLIFFTGGALIFLLGYILLGKYDGRLEYAALVLILGGGVGNLIDRLLNQRVVDYIRLLFIEFPVFNFADICVCTGVGLFALSLLLHEKSRKGKAGHAAA